MIMKSLKLFSGMLATVMAAAALGATLTASAADVAVKISSTEAEAGGDFKVTVDLSGIPSSGLSTVDLAIKYDSSVLEISDVALGDIANTGAKSKEGEYGETLWNFKDTGKEVVAVWATGLTDSSYWIKSDGTFITISGKVKSGVADGTVAKLEAVAVDRPEYPGGSANSDVILSAVGDTTVDYTAAITNGAVTIGKGTPSNRVWGDADCSGTFEMGDLVMLAKASAGLSGAELTVNGKANCDLNEDGSVNGVDMQNALKLMAGIYNASDMPLK